jgi:hypothetical protein
MDRILAVVNRGESQPHQLMEKSIHGPRRSAHMPRSSRSPAVPVVESLRLIEEAAAVIEVGQGDPNQVEIITASLATIWDAVDRNAGVRAAAIDTLEIARALAEVEAPPERFRLRRLLRQALAKLRDRVGAPGLTAEVSAERTLAQAA